MIQFRATFCDFRENPCPRRGKASVAGFRVKRGNHAENACLSSFPKNLCCANLFREPCLCARRRSRVSALGAKTTPVTPASPLSRKSLLRKSFLGALSLCKAPLAGIIGFPSYRRPTGGVYLIPLPAAEPRGGGHRGRGPPLPPNLQLSHRNA